VVQSVSCSIKLVTMCKPGLFGGVKAVLYHRNVGISGISEHFCNFTGGRFRLLRHWIMIMYYYFCSGCWQSWFSYYKTQTYAF
jgi:hypothetical protein